MLTNLTFMNNSATIGGGMHNQYGSPLLVNVAFISNAVTDCGGGMNNYDSTSAPTLVNVTFAGNSAVQGAGLCNDNNSHPILTNDILWGNSAMTGTQIVNLNGGGITVTYSLVQDGWSGTGNLSADPQFVGAAHGDLRLKSTSPAIDAGNNAAVPADTFELDGDGNVTEPIPFDLDGRFRFADVPSTTDTGAGTPPIVDMGAYEAPNKIYLPLVLRN